MSRNDDLDIIEAAFDDKDRATPPRPTTESQYLEFVREEESESGKTQVWAVVSKRHGFTLGMIRWYGAWRQYVFYPAAETLFNTGCLHDLDNFLESLMYQWRESRRSA